MQLSMWWSSTLAAPSCPAQAPCNGVRPLEVVAESEAPACTSAWTISGAWVLLLCTARNLWMQAHVSWED